MKIIIFYPLNPYPPQSGTHRRLLAVLKSLKKSGFKIYLLSADFTSKERSWNRTSIYWLKKFLVEDVVVYKISFFDRIFNFLIFPFNKLCKRPLKINSITHTPPDMLRWFDKQFQIIQPQTIIINYVYWSRLATRNRYKDVKKIIEIHDLVTINNQMMDKLNSDLFDNIQKKYKNSDLRLFDENYFSLFRVDTDNKEYKLFDKFDYVISISSKETELIKKNIKEDKVKYLPMFFQSTGTASNYTGQAIFTSGFSNPYNTHGFLFFVNKVLPLIQKKDKTFILEISGRLYGLKSIALTIPGIRFIGTVDNLYDYFRNVAFFVSPVLAGTGQQIKTVEAMAFGLPVIIHKNGLRGEPIIHGKNGFIANDANSMAEYCVELWQDRNKCRLMGNAARKTIEKMFLVNDFDDKLKHLINK